jgi:hypothetical protein
VIAVYNEAGNPLNLDAEGFWCDPERPVWRLAPRPLRWAIRRLAEHRSGRADHRLYLCSQRVPERFLEHAEPPCEK